MKLIHRLVGAALLCGAAFTPALADAPPFKIIGHNGAWTIQARSSGDCMMTAKAIDDGKTAVGLLQTPVDPKSPESPEEQRARPWLILWTSSGPIAEGTVVSVTNNKNGDLLFSTRVGIARNQPDQTMVTKRLSVDDALSLATNALMNSPTTDGEKVVVTVRAGDVAFSVDVTGAQEAYGNLAACAGDGS
jgi:hypothetical protein